MKVSAWEQIWAWWTATMSTPVAIANLVVTFTLVLLGVALGWTLRWAVEEKRKRNDPLEQIRRLRERERDNID